LSRRTSIVYTPTINKSQNTGSFNKYRRNTNNSDPEFKVNEFKAAAGTRGRRNIYSVINSNIMYLANNVMSYVQL